MYRKMVEAVVAGLVLVAKTSFPLSETTYARRNGAIRLAAILLARPESNVAAMDAKIKTALQSVGPDFQHTKLAEERIVEEILA